MLVECLPGSLPLSSELCQMILPPVRLVVNGILQAEILDLVCAANSRTPDERMGDLRAQVAAANATGIKRFRRSFLSTAARSFQQSVDNTIRYSAEMVRISLDALPNGSAAAVDILESDSAGAEPPSYPCGRECRSWEPYLFRFYRIVGQVGQLSQRHRGYHAFFALLRGSMPRKEDIPTNEGCFEHVHVIAQAGSVVNAGPAAAVAGGNVETSRRKSSTRF